MEFEKIVEKILQEDNVSGGSGSAFGPNVGSTATPFSGDNYAKGDARRITGVFDGILTRNGMSKKASNKKAKKRKKAKKWN